MSKTLAPLLDRIRQPEHTGENRCLPCTAVNSVLAVAATGLASLVAVEAGAVVLVASALAIALRGYLVPGTPTLTRRYLPGRVLAAFDKRPGATDPSDAHEFETVEKIERQRRNAVDPERFLLDVDAVGSCDDRDDLCLTDEFAALVEDRAERFREAPVDRDRTAALFDVDPDEVTFKDRAYPAVLVDRRVRKWPSEGALVADVATDAALSARTDRWADVPLEQRLEILETLRSFHETCPLCGGAVGLGSDAVESCCRSYEVVALACVDCEKPLLEFDPEAVGGGESDRGIRP